MKCKHYYKRNLNGVDMHFCDSNGHLLGGWIKCSDRLPDKEGHYLIHLVTGFIEEYDVTSFSNNRWVGWTNDKVTHWQELPAPPEESK